MKINSSLLVQPGRLEDAALNQLVGRELARMSDEDVQAAALREAEARAVRRIARRFQDLARGLQDSAKVNSDWLEAIHGPDRQEAAPVLGDLLAVISADQDGVDTALAGVETQLANLKLVHAAISGEVGTTSHERFIGPDRHEASPLARMSGLIDMVALAEELLGQANQAWTEKIDTLVELAGQLNDFAATEQSVSMNYIDQLSPDCFELQIARLLRRDGGCIVQEQGGSGDHGADVIAIDAFKRRVVCQCKHSTNTDFRIRPEVVYALNGTAKPEHGADIAAIVTNRGVSDQARAFAVRHGIHVVDRKVLTMWATYGVLWLPPVAHAAESGEPMAA